MKNQDKYLIGIISISFILVTFIRSMIGWNWYIFCFIFLIIAICVFLKFKNSYNEIGKFTPAILLLSLIVLLIIGVILVLFPHEI
jgi:branched-subunit amino acid permease